MDLSHITQKQVAELEELFFQCALGLLRASKKFSLHFIHPLVCTTHGENQTDSLPKKTGGMRPLPPSSPRAKFTHQEDRASGLEPCVLVCVCLGSVCEGVTRPHSSRLMSPK